MSCKKINDKRFLQVKFEEMKRETQNVLSSDNVNRNLKGKDKITNKNIQAYTLVDHLGDYGLEGYGETPVPNDYGLVNNNGQVYTVRDDDLPFDEARHSFAVEESTENFVINGQPLDMSNWFLNNALGTSSIIEVIDNSFYWHDIVLTEESLNHSYGAPQLISDVFGENLKGYITLSFYAKSNIDNAILRSVFRQDGSSLAISKKNYYLTTEYKRYSFTIYLDPGDDVYLNTLYFVPLTDQPDIKYWIKNVQVENKSFATSFVDGTRDSGKLTLPIYQTFNNGFVLNFNYKLNRPVIYYKQIIDIIGLDTNNNEIHGGIVAGYYNELYIKRPSDSRGINIETIMYDMYYNFMYIYDALNFKYYFYLNGQKVMEENIENNNDKIAQITNIKLNRFYNPAYNLIYGGLFSNLYIGEYDPNIWTDEFIQELYNKQVLAKSLAQIDKSPTPPKAIQNKYNISKMGELLTADYDLWQSLFNNYNFDQKCITAGWRWNDD